MRLMLNIRPIFEQAKKCDSYGHENKISNTTIINKLNNKTEILNIFSHKKNDNTSSYSLASIKCAYCHDNKNSLRNILGHTLRRI